MGFLDLFIKNENEGTTPAQAAQVTTSVGQSGQPQQVIPQVQFNAPAPIPGAVDSKFMKHFEAILEKANIPGADFYEFSKTLEGMSAMNLPEQQTYQMAFIAFKSMNPGKTDAELVGILTGTAKTYLDALSTDKTNFEAAITNETQAKVGNLQKEQELLVNRQAQIDQEIARLQEERQQNQEGLIKVSSDIQIQTSRIVSNHNNYTVSFETICAAINTVIERIGRYNGGTPTPLV